MTEAEWLACDDPAPMLDHLRGRASERKLRLFAVSCCRRLGCLREHEVGKALETAERFADGLGADADHSNARKTAQRAAQGREITRTPTAPKWERRAASAVYYAAARDAGEAAWNARQLIIESLVWRAGGYGACDAEAIRVNEQESQAALVRDIFGNPFRPIILEPRWRTADVLGLARGIYEDRAFERMPLLADALMDAGCDSDQLLAHCRSEGPHVRGCWAVDLVLGKESPQET